MNLSWTFRIVGGPLRPFLFGKVRDSVRERWSLLRLWQTLPTAPSEGRTLRENIVPLPSSAWFSQHSDHVLTFARRMRSGTVGAYGINRWKVGDADPSSVDVRCVHELSRMHHWCAYALAAHIDPSNRDAWCEQLVQEIVTFSQSYPVGTGVHWQFPMGIGIRLHSMLVAWDWARRSGWSNADADRRIAAMAIDHAKLTLARRESRGGLSTSHYAANLLGILAAGCYLQGTTEAGAWRQLAVRELKRELLRQVFDGGLSNEASTGYHRQIVDTFVHAFHLIHLSGDAILHSSDYHRRLTAAIAWCQYLDQLGMPLIGDNDDGLSVKLTGFEPSLSYTYDVANRLLGNNTVARTASAIVIDQQFGIAVLRDDGVQCTIRSGPFGQFGKGGHAHNDQGSVTVRVDGHWIVVDPGSSTYTDDHAQRNAERSACHHSTMWWRDQEQGAYPPGEGGLFWLLGDRIRSEIRENGTGQIQCTTHRKGLGTHERTIAIEHGEVLGHDQCTGADLGAVDCVFVFHPDVTVNPLDESSVLVQSGGVHLRLSWSQGVGRIEPGTVSPRFSEITSTSVLRIAASHVSWRFERYTA